MTAIATQQVISNGPRNLILKYTIGGTPLGDVTADTLVDISSLDTNIGVGGYRLEKATWSLTGMSCKLAWEGASDVDLIQLSAGDGEVDFSEAGGVVNNASIPTGNVVYTTTGYGTAGDGGSMVLEFKKKSASSAILAEEADVGTGSMAIAGAAPLAWGHYNPFLPGTDSMAITGAAPLILTYFPSLGSMTIASDIVVVTNAAP